MAELRTLVVSATHLLARGFQVVPIDRRSRDGKPVNGLFAVARAVLHALEWKTPEHAVAVIDRGERAWPALLVPQLEQLSGLLEALGLSVVETRAEAPLVASYVRAALAAGEDAVIVGADKRYAQLVSDQVWWYDAIKEARYTPEIVRKRFGVGPDRVADWLALVGDDDQVPGVKGIGSKGATALLDAHGRIEAALEATTLEPRLRKALEAARSQLPTHLANARLTSLALPVPLAQLGFRSPRTEALNPLLEALGFVELLRSTAAATQVTLARSKEEVSAGLLRLRDRTVGVAALIDEDGQETARVAGVALSAGDETALYVPATGPGWESLMGWFEDPRAAKTVHDAVPLRVALERTGVQLAGVVGDSACVSHLTQPSGWAPHELPGVARQVLGRSLPDDDEVLGTGAKRKRWSQLGDAAGQIAADRASVTQAVFQSLAPHVDASLLGEYLELSETVSRMERFGVAVDAAGLEQAERALVEIERGLQGEIEALAGHSFNINSSAQLGQVLFDELKLPILGRTKTGYSTANEVLERLEHAHPIVSRVLRWRTVRRLADSWVHSLERCIASDGRVHARFHIARSFSGQIVSTHPDLTRVPGRTPEMALIRQAFVAPTGRLLMSVDFHQLGLYVLAHLTEDPALVEPLLRREDLHRLTAAAVLDKAPEDVTLEERQLGKVINFATFAGQGSSALALQLGVTPAEAKEYIARFDRHYARVRAFQDQQLRLAKERGFVLTLAGRRWPIGGLESLDPQLRSYAERMARRGPHEGSVADVSRRALLRADQALRRAKLHAMPLVEVVDEVLFEVAESELQESARVCVEAMANAFPLRVPLVLGVEAGRSWAELAPLPETLLAPPR